MKCAMDFTPLLSDQAKSSQVNPRERMVSLRLPAVSQFSRSRSLKNGLISALKRIDPPPAAGLLQGAKWSSPNILIALQAKMEVLNPEALIISLAYQMKVKWVPLSRPRILKLKYELVDITNRFLSKLNNP